MSEEQTSDAAEFESFASKIWDDEARRYWARDQLKVNLTNRWLFSSTLKEKLDPRLWNDPDYCDQFLEDLDDRLKGGSILDRDEWFEWSDDKYERFRRWVHRRKKPKLPVDQQNKPFTRPQIKKWFDEWDKLDDWQQAHFDKTEPME